MKRFISKSKIKFPRYKMIYRFLFGFLFLIFFIDFIISKSLSEDLVRIMESNIWGNQNMNKDFFIKNSFGFKKNDSTNVNSNDNNLKDIFIEVDKLEDPLIYIYNTFQTDKYKNNYYSSYSVNPVVTQASLMMQEYFKNNKINSIVEKNSVVKVLKDNGLLYTNSYKGSRMLMEEAKKNNPTLKYFLDIQVSDNIYEVTTVEMDGKAFAKVLFIVGTDNVNYAGNQKFAQDLHDLLEEKYAGISMGVSLRGGSGYQGIYNQDFNENTLLIQIGGSFNTIDEVNRTLKILTEVITEYVRREMDES